MKNNFLLIGVLLLLISACSNNIKSDYKSVDKSTQSLVPLDEIISGGPPKDGIPAIDSPEFVTIKNISEKLNDDSRGVLVNVENEYRFYPFVILVWHEIVNDEINGIPLVITYCPLCQSSVVFERTIDGIVYDFGTSGKLYESNLVMYDRQTNSYWSQVLGKAITGEMIGTELTKYSASITTLGDVKNISGLKILSVDTGYVREYGLDPYTNYYDSDEILFPVSHKDNRLPAKTMIYGINIEDKFKAYDYTNLLNVKKLNDTLNGHELEISVDMHNQIIIYDKTSSKKIIGFIAYWFSWITHNPDADLWIEN